MAIKPKSSGPKTSAEEQPGTGPKNPSIRSSQIDEKILSLGDWRGTTLTEIRRLIHEAVPEIEEGCKWVKPTNPSGVPTWSCAGIVCTGETYKQVVKLTFARGAALPDPQGLFNSSLDGNTRRAIDIREGEELDAEAFKALIQAALAENLRSSALKSKDHGQT